MNSEKSSILTPPLAPVFLASIAHLQCELSWSLRSSALKQLSPHVLTTFLPSIVTMAMMLSSLAAPALLAPVAPIARAPAAASAKMALSDVCRRDFVSRILTHTKRNRVIFLEHLEFGSFFLRGSG